MDSETGLQDHRAALLNMLNQEAADLTQQLTALRAADIAEFLV